jgi:dUTP pyrophosphatase
MLDIRAIRLDAGLDLPGTALAGDAGLDLRSRIDSEIAPAGGRALLPTGIAIELPEGAAGLVLPRSGLAIRHGVTILNAPGLVDSGYRGELSAILVNTDPLEPFLVRRGDRIAQLVVVDVRTVRLVEATELSATERGGGGFGHSGRR